MTAEKEYPKPSLTADICMFRREEGALQLLLVKRGCQPFQGSWALPGGFVGEGETAEAAASRELAEETGLSQLPLEPLGFYDASGRDPRGWVVSQAFVARCNQGLIASAGDDATDTRWFAVRMSNQADGALKLELGSEALTLFVTFDEETLPITGTSRAAVKGAAGLAFDHARIVADALLLLDVMPCDESVAHGELTAEDAEGIVDNLDSHESILDFSDVSKVSFAAMRVLFDARNEGKSLKISNASRAVCAAFDTTGVSKYVSVCARPRTFDMSAYSHSGEGFTARSFNSDDGDSMMKLYNSFVPLESIEREKRYAQTAMYAGIPTPLSGDILKIGNKNGITFERIGGKRSVARAVGDNPDDIGEYATAFATLCKKLHSTPCDSSVFPSVIEEYKKMVMDTAILDPAEKKDMLAFLETVPDTGHCLHGDLVPSRFFRKFHDSLGMAIGLLLVV